MAITLREIIEAGAEEFGLLLGPASSTTNRIAMFDDTTGKSLKESAFTVPVNSGTDGYVLTTNGTGAATWAPPGIGTSFPLAAPDDDGSGNPSYSFASNTGTGLRVDDVTGNLQLMRNAGVELELALGAVLNGNDGDNGDPAWSFINETNTGVYRPAASTLAFSVGGNERLRITNSALTVGTYTLPMSGSATTGHVLQLTGPNVAAWQAPAAGFADPMTARGDIIYRTAANATDNLPSGSEDQVLTVINASGDIGWATPVAGFADPMTTAGDIIYKNGSDVTTRLPRGTANQVLTTSGSTLAWADPVAEPTYPLASDASGTAAAPDYAFSGATTTGMYRTTVNAGPAINFSLGGSQYFELANNGLKIGTGVNSFVLPIADGAANQVLTTDGFGDVVWADISLSPSIAEVTDVTITSSAATFDVSGSGLYWNIPAQGGTNYYVWYNVTDGTNTQTDPAPGGTGVQVDIVAADVASAIATKTAAAVDLLSDFSVPVPVGATLEVTQENAGDVTDASDGSAGVTVLVTTQGSAASSGFPLKGTNGQAVGPTYSFTNSVGTGMHLEGGVDVNGNANLQFSVVGANLLTLRNGPTAPDQMLMHMNGTKLKPALSFIGADNMGMYRDINSLKFSTAGIDRLEISNSGITIGNTLAVAGWYKLPLVDGADGAALTTDGSGTVTWEVPAGSSFTELIDDATPQLGAALDVNGFSIVSVAAGNIAITPDTTGSVILDGSAWPQDLGTDGYLLKTNGAGQLSWVAGPTGGSLPAVLGGELSVLKVRGAAAEWDIDFNDMTKERSGKVSGIFTIIEWKDGTVLRKRSTLSGGVPPLYTTRTVNYYDTDGTTILNTKVYTLSYDVDDDFESEVV